MSGSPTRALWAAVPLAMLGAALPVLPAAVLDLHSNEGWCLDRYGALHAYLQDASYNVAAIVDPNLQTQRQYTYEPYGEVVFAETAGGDPNLLPVNRIGHQGLFFERFLLDPNDTFATPALDPNAVGVYVTRNRPYSPRLARWLSRDPHGTALPIRTTLPFGGERLGAGVVPFSPDAHYVDGVNLYRYVASNPPNRTDPSGAFSLIELNQSTSFAVDQDMNSLDMGMTFLDAFRGFGDIVSTRNALLSELTGVAMSGPDLSGIDLATGIWKTYQMGQSALFAGGILKAGAQYGQRGAMAIYDNLKARYRQRHHGIPLFMGGLKDQILYHAPKHLHERFHAQLNIHLERAGLPRDNRRFEEFLERNPGAQRKAFNVLHFVAEKFDSQHGTKFGTTLDLNLMFRLFREYD